MVSHPTLTGFDSITVVCCTCIYYVILPTGGSVNVAIDFLGMREYARINPQLRNLDTLYELLVESEIIPSEVASRCNIEFSLANRNLEIILQAVTSDDQEFCSDLSTRVAEIIDNPQDREFVLDSFQFATAAVSSAPVSDDRETTETTENSASGTVGQIAEYSSILSAITVSMFVAIYGY